MRVDGMYVALIGTEMAEAMVITHLSGLLETYESREG